MDVTIETRTMLPTRAIVRWATANAAGLEFMEAPRTGTVAPATRPGTPVPRSPRFALDSEVRLVVDDRRIVARTRDIALGGLKLTGLDGPLPGGPARVELADMGRTLAGRIRWNLAASAGFQFATPLSSQDLAAFLDPMGRIIQ